MTVSAYDIIRLIGGEFADISDSDLKLWIEICRPMVSRKQFGRLYEQALAFMVCHKLKMGGNGNNPLGELGVIGAGFSLGSVSEGGSSVSFGAGQSSNLAPDAELGLTVYGLQYLSLRRMAIVPIHISGESYGDIPVHSRGDTGIINPDSGGSAGGENPDPGDAGGSETPSEIPVATETTLGGVRVRQGSGLLLEGDGSLSVDVDGLVGNTSGSSGQLPGGLGDVDPYNPFPNGGG